ncbi:hypothetical protein F5B20DRAFT_550606 [Whalleya microplaca]|nr:hypothetical protein F5B20DRAFT_550606 [Whalleya microplaca]
MYSTRLIRLLMVALSILTITQAAWFDGQVFGRGDKEIVEKRQDIISSAVDRATSSDAPSSTDEPASSATQESTTTDQATSATNNPTTDNTTPAPSTTTGAGTTRTNPTTATQTDGTTTDGTTKASTTTGNTTPTSTNGGTKATSTSPSGTTDSGNGSSDVTSESPSTTPQSVTSTTVVFFTTTDSNGQQTVASSSSQVVMPAPTQDSAESSNSGPSKQAKNVIIGVCVGVGGAIVLGVAGLLFWRLRSKKRNHEENEELVSYGDGFAGPGTAEKSDAGTTNPSRSPFQSTLESYHAPTQTNAASNF